MSTSSTEAMIDVGFFHLHGRKLNPRWSASYFIVGIFHASYTKTLNVSRRFLTLVELNCILTPLCGETFENFPGGIRTRNRQLIRLML